MDSFWVALLVGVGIGLLSYGGRRPAQSLPDGSGFTMRPSAPYRALAWFNLASGVAVPVLAVVLGSDPDDRWAVLALIVILGGVGALLLNDCRGHVTVTDRGIQAFSPWRGRFDIPWGEIAWFDYDGLSHWFVLLSRDGRKVRVSTFYSGVPQFVEKVRGHVAGDICERALSSYSLRHG